MGDRPQETFHSPMHARSETRLSTNLRPEMPLLRSLMKGQGASAAIDMALLRSLSEPLGLGCSTNLERELPGRLPAVPPDSIRP
jgi:hypothetical protein